MEEQSPNHGNATADPEASVSFQNSTSENVKNGRKLQRIETVPDIKRDTSGITTQYIASGIVNLGAFAAGVCVSWSSSTLPLFTRVSEISSVPNDGIQGMMNVTMHHKLQMTEHEASWAASLLCMGAVWGAIPAGLISEYFGRKKTLLYLALPLLVSWLLIASSPNVYGLYVGRFVSGVAMGAFSVAIPPYVADIAESQILPALANFYHVMFSGGILFGYIIGMVQSASWISVLCTSLPVAFFVAFLFLPESPIYLMSQGKTNEAKTALRYFRGIDNDVDGEIKQIKEYLRSYARNKVNFQHLLQNRATVKAFVVSFGLMIFQQIGGIFPILFYAERIFKTFSLSMNPPGAAIILGFCLVSSTYFSTLLLRLIRRRALLILSFISMSLSVGSLAVFYNLKAPNLSTNTWVPLFTLCAFVSTYAAGVGPIPWLMLREIFPSNVTRRATAITAGFHWFLAFLVTKLYQNMIDMVRPGWVLSHFAITCLFGALFVYFVVPETKDRSLQEIQDEFRGIHKKKKHTHIIEVESVSDV